MNDSNHRVALGSQLRLLYPVLLLASWSCQGLEGSASAQPDGTAPARSEAELLIERSIDYHDPERTWYSEATPVAWTSSRPDGEISFHFDLEFGPGGDFLMVGDRKGKLFEYRVHDNHVSASVDGSDEISDKIREEMVLVRDEGLFWRDYFGFLGGMPMNLLDGGVTITPAVRETELEGNRVQAVDVSFSAEFGTDFWTYFFELETARLVACRFHRQDPTADGEIILFEGESSIGSLKLPRKRRWYMNADQRFLGTDELRSFSDGKGGIRGD